MKTPQVTVLTTVYNGERFLRPCLESVLNQRFTDFEFLIVDDGSTDATFSIAKSYKDPRIVLVQAGRVGRSRALNYGLALAKGKYVAIQDADDVSLPNRLTMQHEIMEANEELDFVGSFCTIIDESGKCIDRACLQTNADYRLWRLQFQCNYYTTSVMMKKRTAIEAGMFPESLVVAHDYDLFVRMARRSNTLMIPEFLCQYRMFRGGQLTTTHYGAMVDEAAKISNEALKTCNPCLTDTECAEMRPMYWALERRTMTSAGLRAVRETLEGFCARYELTEDDSSRLARKVAGDALRAIIMNCEGSAADRLDLALSLVRESPSAIQNFLLMETKRTITRVFKRTRIYGPVLRFVHQIVP
jgi:hypothetical protein